MGNLARQLREQVLAEHPQAQVVERGRNNIRFQLGENEFHLVATLDDIHLDDGTEIDTDWADDTGEQGAISVPYRHLFDKQGKRIFVPRPEFPNETITFSTPKVKGTNNRWSNLNMPGKLRKGSVMEFSGNGFRLEIINTAHGPKVNFVALNATVVRPIRWDVTLTGLTRNGRQFISQVDGSVVASYPEFTMIDAEGEERLVAENITDIALELHPDTTGMVFPVEIDPTISQRQDISLNDGYALTTATGTGYNATGAVVAGRTSTTSVQYLYDSWIRWQGLSALRGATISAATMTFTQYTASTTAPSLNIKGQESADPTTPTSYEDFWNTTARPRTANNTNWSPTTATGSKTTPSLVSITQEIVNSFPSTLESIQYFITPNTRTLLAKTSTGTNHDRLTARSGDYSDTTVRPTLSITYTAPTNTAPTFTVAPVVNYATGYSALGPNASPATITFTATDAEQTGTNGLNWWLYTLDGAAYNARMNGTFTSGQQVTVTIPHDVAWLYEGSTTIRISVNDNSLTTNATAIPLVKDTVAPSHGTITVTPQPVTGA